MESRLSFKVIKVCDRVASELGLQRTIFFSNNGDTAQIQFYREQYDDIQMEESLVEHVSQILSGLGRHVSYSYSLRSFYLFTPLRAMTLDVERSYPLFFPRRDRVSVGMNNCARIRLVCAGCIALFLTVSIAM